MGVPLLSLQPPHTVSSFFHSLTHKVFFVTSAVCCLWSLVFDLCLLHPRAPAFVSLRSPPPRVLRFSSLRFSSSPTTYDFCLFLQLHLFPLAAVFAPSSFPTFLLHKPGLGPLQLVFQLSSTIAKPRVYDTVPKSTPHRSTAHQRTSSLPGMVMRFAAIGNDDDLYSRADY
jgi:hypothetical protein